MQSEKKIYREFDLEVIGPKPTKINEKIVQSGESNNQENKVTDWLNKIVKKLKNKSSSVNLADIKGV